MAKTPEAGFAPKRDAKREGAETRQHFLDALRRGSRVLPAALVGVFLTACAAETKGAKYPKSGEGDYGFVLGRPPGDMDEVRADIQKRLAGQGAQAPSREPAKISDVGFETSGGGRVAETAMPVARAEGASRGLPVQGFERAGIPDEDIWGLIEALPGNGFVSVRYATTCENRPSAEDMGRSVLAGVDIPTDNRGAAQWDKPSLAVYGPECFGNTPQAREMFMNYLGQEVALAYAFAHLPQDLRGFTHTPNPLDALMEPHRGPEIQYAPGPVFQEPILNGFAPPGLRGDQLKVRQQQVYWASLVNSALHVRLVSSKEKWRDAFMLRLATTHRAPADKARAAVELVTRFFASRDPNADPDKFVRDFQTYEERLKTPMVQRDVQAAVMGAVRDQGLRTLLVRVWQAGVNERATYLDFSPHVKPDQRTPYMREADGKLEQAQAALRERAVKEPNITATVNEALNFAHALSELHRLVANNGRYAPVHGMRIAQQAAKLDAAFNALSPQDRQKAMPLVIQAMRVAYYGDPIKE